MIFPAESLSKWIKMGSLQVRTMPRVPSPMGPHRFPVVGAHGVTHGGHCLVVSETVEDCHPREDVPTTWHKIIPDCHLRCRFVWATRLPKDSLNTHFWGRRGSSAGCKFQTARLLKVSDILTPTVFICFDVGTRQPWLRCWSGRRELWNWVAGWLTG